MPRRSRSRSRSPRRDRNRDRSRERRDRDRDRDRDRERSRREGREHDRTERDRDREREERIRERERERDRENRERASRQSRSPDRNKASGSTSGPLKTEKKKFTAEDFSGKTDEEIEMMKLMGFGGFDTTKGKKVEGNDAGAVHVKLKRNYRQYMNRRGGFNRPLDAVH